MILKYFNFKHSFQLYGVLCEFIKYLISQWLRKFWTANLYKISEKLTFLTFWYVHHTRTGAYYGVKMLVFGKIFQRFAVHTLP